MPHALNDRLLLVGAALAVTAAVSLSYYNFFYGAIPRSNWRSLLMGTLIALLCAIIAIGIDLQDAVTVRLGGLASTSILQCWQGWASLIGWGAFNVTMFQAVLLDPQWAKETLHFEVGNNLTSTGLLVGMSALVIIRSKLMKVNNIEWGVEWLYLWSSAQTLSAVNRQRIATKAHWERHFQYLVTDLGKYPTFFTDLESHLINILQGSPPKVQAALQKEFEQLRANYIPAGTPNPEATINGSMPARRALVRVVLDHLGHADMLAWASTLP